MYFKNVELPSGQLLEIVASYWCRRITMDISLK